MRRYLIPRTNLWAAPLCLGTGSFTVEQERQAREQLDCFVDLGGNLIDTANIYGQKKTGDENSSERIIGRWLQDRGQPADILVSSKGGHPPLEDLHRSRLDADSLTADLDLSRRTLGRDCLDLYFLHRDDPAQPAEALLSQLERFRQAGWIRYYGLSNWSAGRLEQALAWCGQLEDCGLAAVQNRWSLAQYNPEGSPDDTLAAVDAPVWQILRRQDLALLAYSAMAKGFFNKLQPVGGQPVAEAGTGREPSAQLDFASLPEKLRRYYLNDLNLRRAEAVWAIAADRKRPPAQIALAWLLQQPFPVFPVVSFSALHQIEEAMGTPAIQLTEEEMQRLSAGSVC